MNFLTIILWVISHASSIINLIKAIVAFIQGIKNPAAHAEAMKDFAAAFQSLRQTGNADALNQVAQKWCPGPEGCPATTVDAEKGGPLN